MKEKQLLNLFFLIALSVGMASCGSSRALTYFNDLEDTTYRQAIQNVQEPRIQVGDILSITVSSLDPASNSLFNTGALPTSDRIPTTNTAGASDLAKQGYLVGQDGNINFPLIDKVHLQGLSLADAHQKLKTELEKYVKQPIVNIRYQNFKVTVIGEVQRPLTFTVNNERISVLEALGMAGDMTAYGRRENVLVIREINGEREIARLDLGSSTTLNSPYFYLQQNDIVYVEPRGTRDPSGARTLTIISTTAAVVTALSLMIQRIF